MKLFKDDTLDIRLDNGLNLLKIKTLKSHLDTVTTETVKDIFFEIQAKRILLNFDSVETVDKEALSVIEGEFGKTLKQTGARKIAIVTKRDDLKSAFEHLQQVYEVKKLKWNYFDNVESAEKWLREI